VGVLRLFHVGLFHTVAPLCNSLRNEVASMETHSSWMNCPKEKCVSADLMHLLLVRFVTVRLTYIFIDYPDCEYIIILNTSIVIQCIWFLGLVSLAKLHPFNAHIWKSPSPKSLFVDKYENDTHAPVYYQYDTYVAEFHKKRKMYTSSVADKWCWEVNRSLN
jgi:hypothetical protein